MDKRGKKQLFFWKKKVLCHDSKEQEWHAHSLHTVICAFLLVFGEMILMEKKKKVFCAMIHTDQDFMLVNVMMAASGSGG